jgi:uncharacterized membrane protein
VSTTKLQLHAEHITFIAGSEVERDVDGTSAQLLQAFSHFTWEASMRTMLVLLHCDGDGNVVPEIHTVNATGFGSTNMGTAAIDVFFKTHEWCVQSVQESVQE